MSSDPTFPILVKYDGTRRRWLSTWYDVSGIRHSKSFGWEHEVSVKRVRVLYDAWMLTWRNRPDLQHPTGPDAEYTIARLCGQYLRHASRTFRKKGKPTSHVWNVRMAMRELRDAHGGEPSAAFDAPKLATLRDSMIYTTGQDGKDKVRAAKTVNGRLSIIQAAFIWAREKGRVPAAVVADVISVVRIKKGRTDAKPSKAVKSIGISFVDDVVRFMPEVVADMVRLLSYTGLRPHEICEMRTCDIEAGGDVWLFRPSSHKLEHLEDEGETIRFLGPQAQGVVRRYLKLNREAYMFSPREAEAQRKVQKRKDRMTPLYPSHLAKIKLDASDRLGDRYTTESFRRAIHYACKKAGAAKWNPGQLRHTVATRLRKRYGIEDASVHLGHKHLSTTEIYAEKDAQRAMQIAKEAG